MVKALNPNIQIIGVEPAGANAMCQVRAPLSWVGWAAWCVCSREIFAARHRRQQRHGHGVPCF